MLVAAYLIMTAPTILHAKQENVSTHVLLQMSVLLMQTVELQDIKQYAHVQMDTLVRLKYLAHYVSLKYFYHRLLYLLSKVLIYFMK